MTRKLYIKTWGCQMNEYDSAKMAEVLGAAHGLALTDVAEEADVLLLNTCSIRERAEEKVFSLLGVWREWKAARPDMIIGVGGCVASQEGEGILRRAPYVDIIFGPQTLHRLPELLDQRRNTRRPAVDITFPEIEKFDHLPPPRADGPTAFVSVMEGCSKYCTFCVVPYTRGPEVSRPFDDVLNEVALLAAQGVREVTLLGQNVNAYRGVMHDGSIADLALLIEYLAAIDGIGRIRYTTSHPLEFGDRLIAAYANVPQLANQLHLPVQSGADRVLARMKRGHTALEYKAKIRKLRQVRPDISVSSDFIVGFPGETEDDFAATLNLVEEIVFDRAFSFAYSPRPGTPATSFPDHVAPEVQRERLARLQALINQQAAARAQGLLHSVQRVLVERRARDGSLSGCAEDNRVVHMAGDDALIGRFVEAQITEVLVNSLRGRIARVCD